MRDLSLLNELELRIREMVSALERERARNADSIDIRKASKSELRKAGTLLVGAGYDPDEFELFDGWIAPMGTQVIELGPLNKTIHQIDEQIPISDLEKTEKIYLGIHEEINSN